MAFDVLQSLSLTVVFVLLVLVLVAATEVGDGIGRRHGRERTDDEDAGALATPLLGLLALLIAFTYAMTLTRYDLRRQVVLEEANAIGSTLDIDVNCASDATRVNIVSYVAVKGDSFSGSWRETTREMPGDASGNIPEPNTFQASLETVGGGLQLGARTNNRL